MNKRVTEMKVGPGAYKAMANIYREYAQLCRQRMYLTDTDKQRVAQLLEDAAKDYEATAENMV